MLSHFLRAALKDTATPVSCSYVTSYSSTTNASTYTFNSSNIGTAAANRYVVVVVNAEGTTGRSMSSVTIGGTAATLHSNVTAVYPVGFAGLTVTSGTTANIVVTMSGSVNNLSISIYTLYDLVSTTAIDTSSAITTGTTATISDLQVQQNGVVIAGVSSNGTGTYTLSGVTEQYDATVETRRANGYSLTTSNSATYTVSSTSSVTQNSRLVAVSWR